MSRSRTVVERDSDLFPRGLNDLERPPHALFVDGELPRPGARRVAIVGSRSPSPSGVWMAYGLARELARAGVVVASGLARGIDSAAHRGALDGGGATVAFLGCGVDVMYPRSSRELGASIVSNGALVSEYPDGSPPRPFRFVERNRLLAAYTEATIVVEAGEKSGALITAGIALQYGRYLWSVPGDPRRPCSRGSNRLLRDGAGVALDAMDVLVGLGLLGSGGETVSMLPAGLSAPEEKVVKVLSECGFADLEVLTRRCRLATATLLEAVSLLELAGHVRREPEGYALTWDSARGGFR